MHAMGSQYDIGGLVQDYSISIANALEILQSCTKPAIGGILPKGPYPPCLRMADRALLAGYRGNMVLCNTLSHTVQQQQRSSTGQGLTKDL